MHAHVSRIYFLVPGGLTLREGMYIVETLLSTGKLTGFDLVEVNPTLGSLKDQEVTVKTAFDLVCSSFGHRAIYNCPDDYEIPEAEDRKQ